MVFSLATVESNRRYQQTERQEAILGKPYSGVCFGVSFFPQSTALRPGNSGTDARFPSKVRQNLVVGE